MCWVGSEMQEIQLNCRRLREGNCRCHRDVMTEIGGRFYKSGASGEGLLWQLSEKGLPHVVNHHHHGNLETDALVPRVSGAVHAPRPGPVLRTQLL